MKLLTISSALLMYLLILILFNEKLSELNTMRYRMNQIFSMGVFVKNDESEESSFKERFLKPLINRIISEVSRLIPISDKEKQKLNNLLQQAGIKIRGQDYAAIKIIVISILSVSFAMIMYIYSNKISSALVGLFLGMLCGYTLFRFSLQKKISTRKKNMEFELPQVLDLLSVCVEAGLGFDQALQYIVLQDNNEMVSEFAIVVREISLGKTRKDALTSLYDRCGIEELKTLSTAIIQADEMGISLKNVLNAQSISIRQNYKQKIEEYAQKIPIKILFPLVLFILPVIFIIILGPAAVQVIRMIMKG